MQPGWTSFLTTRVVLAFFLVLIYVSLSANAARCTTEAMTRCKAKNAEYRIDQYGKLQLARQEPIGEGPVLIVTTTSTSLTPKTTRDPNAKEDEEVSHGGKQKNDGGVDGIRKRAVLVTFKSVITTSVAFPEEDAFISLEDDTAFLATKLDAIQSSINVKEVHRSTSRTKLKRGSVQGLVVRKGENEVDNNPISSFPFELCCDTPREQCVGFEGKNGSLCYNEDNYMFHLDIDVRGSLKNRKIIWPNGTEGDINDLPADYDLQFISQTGTTTSDIPSLVETTMTVTPGSISLSTITNKTMMTDMFSMSQSSETPWNPYTTSSKPKYTGPTDIFIVTETTETDLPSATRTTAPKDKTSNAARRRLGGVKRMMAVVAAGWVGLAALCLGNGPAAQPITPANPAILSTHNTRGRKRERGFEHPFAWDGNIEDLDARYVFDQLSNEDINLLSTLENIQQYHMDLNPPAPVKIKRIPRGPARWVYEIRRYFSRLSQSRQLDSPRMYPDHAVEGVQSAWDPAPVPIDEFPRYEVCECPVCDNLMPTRDFHEGGALPAVYEDGGIEDEPGMPTVEYLEYVVREGFEGYVIVKDPVSL